MAAPPAFLVWDLYKHLPSSIRNPIIGRRHVDIWQLPSNGVMLVHIPKTGGTTLAQTLYGRSTNHYPIWVIEAADPDRFARATLVAVLRDPLERTISALRHCLGAPMAPERDRRLSRWLLKRYGSVGGMVEAYFEDEGLRSKLSRSIMFKPYGFWLGAIDDYQNLQCFRLHSKELPSSVDAQWLNRNVVAEMPQIDQRTIAKARRVLSDDYAWYDNPTNVSIMDVREVAEHAIVKNGMRPIVNV